MAGQIRVTPDELRDGATTINSQKDEIVSLVEQIKSKVDECLGNMEGASQTALVAQFDELYPALHDQFPQCIEGMAMMMSKAADILEQADQDIAAAFQGQ